MLASLAGARCGRTVGGPRARGRRGSRRASASARSSSAAASPRPPLVWIGALALAAARRCLRRRPSWGCCRRRALDRPARVFLGCLFGLAALGRRLDALVDLARPDLGVHEPHARLRRVRARSACSLGGAPAAAGGPARARGGRAARARRSAGRCSRSACRRSTRRTTGALAAASARRSATGTSSRCSETSPCRSRSGWPRRAARRAGVRAAGARPALRRGRHAAAHVLALRRRARGRRGRRAGSCSTADRVESLVAAALGGAAGGGRLRPRARAARDHEGRAAARGARARRLDLRARRARGRRGRRRRSARARACRGAGARSARSGGGGSSGSPRVAALVAVARRARGERRVRGPHLARVHESRLEPDRLEPRPARQPQLEQPLALVDGGVARVHAAIPLGGTGAGTFQLTDLRSAQQPADDGRSRTTCRSSSSARPGSSASCSTSAPPRPRPLGIVRARAARSRGRARGRHRARGRRSPRSSSHTVVDMDWNYVATCGPLLLVAGALARPPRAACRRRPVAAGRCSRRRGRSFALARRLLARRAVARAAAARVGDDVARMRSARTRTTRSRPPH